MPIRIAPGPGAALPPLPEDLSPSAFARLFRLSPARALEYLRGRGRMVTTTSWAELRAEEHALQFTVSRLARLDLLQTIYDGILASVEGDLSRTDWMRDVRARLEEAGWWGRVETVDTDTGEVLTTVFSPSRLRTILDANVRSAHAIGRYERQRAASATHPYLRYITQRDERVRESHAAWDGLVLPVDDPFWESHYPPNGWRCRCRVVSVSRRDYEAGTYRVRGPDGVETRQMVRERPEIEYREWVDKRTGRREQVPVGIDPGWSHNPAEAAARGEQLRREREAKVAAADPALAAAAERAE